MDECAVCEDDDGYVHANGYVCIDCRLEAAESDLAEMREAHSKVCKRLRMWEKDGPAAMKEDDRLRKIIDEHHAAKDKPAVPPPIPEPKNELRKESGGW